MTQLYAVYDSLGQLYYFTQIIPNPTCKFQTFAIPDIANVSEIGHEFPVALSVGADVKVDAICPSPSLHIIDIKKSQSTTNNACDFIRPDKSDKFLYFIAKQIYHIINGIFKLQSESLITSDKDELYLEMSKRRTYSKHDGETVWLSQSVIAIKYNDWGHIYRDLRIEVMQADQRYWFIRSGRMLFPTNDISFDQFIDNYQLYIQSTKDIKMEQQLITFGEVSHFCRTKKHKYRDLYHQHQSSLYSNQSKIQDYKRQIKALRENIKIEKHKYQSKQKEFKRSITPLRQQINRLSYRLQRRR
jgi:hypothetical protein